MMSCATDAMLRWPCIMPENLREVRLQPVLLLVLVRRVLQVPDHLVDVVFERGDLALRFDRDRSRQVALGDGGGDLGDRADLRREVSGELVDVVGQVAPRAGAPGTLAWPPSLPSMPTSRATLVT